MSAECQASLAAVSKSFGARLLLQDVSLDIRSGTSTAIVGKSGSGKSTILSMLLGLVKPSSGTVMVAGRDLQSLSRSALIKHRSATTGMVFQFGELIPEISPLDNVALPGLLAKGDRAATYAKAQELLERFDLPDVGQAETGHLSGGERQRVAVARALIGSPQLILADEPTGSIDAESRDTVARVLFSLPQTLGCALVVVTHDPAVAEQAERVYEIAAGTLRPQAGVA